MSALPHRKCCIAVLTPLQAVCTSAIWCRC
ncbi:Uncharacterised protein [Vibrio cholerae]|nr:Uncharacterised protein [Vibrio cholerae]